MGEVKDLIRTYKTRWWISGGLKKRDTDICYAGDFNLSFRDNYYTKESAKNQ